MALGQSLPAVIRFLLPIEIQDISQSCPEDAMPSVWFPGTAPDTRGAGWVGGGGTQAGQPGLRGLAIWQPCLSPPLGGSREPGNRRSHGRKTEVNFQGGSVWTQASSKKIIRRQLKQKRANGLLYLEGPNRTPGSAKGRGRTQRPEKRNHVLELC